MNKLFLGLGLLASIGMLSNCKKDVETSSMSYDMSKKATIVVYAYADLDRTQYGNEYAPNGTNVLVTIPRSSFNPSATGYWSNTATIQDGKFEMQIPVNSVGVTASIKPLEFSFDQVQPNGSNSATIKKVYKVTAAIPEGDIKEGETRTVEIQYDAPENYDNFYEMILCKYKIEAELADTVLVGDVPYGTTAGSVIDLLPQNTLINIYNNGFNVEHRLATAGNVDINLPVNESLTIEFEMQKKVVTVTYVNNGGDVTKTTVDEMVNYRYRAQIDIPATPTPIRQDVMMSDELWQ